jgi:hypothetical protein
MDRKELNIKRFSRKMICAVMSILLIASMTQMLAFADEATDYGKNKDEEARYIVRPVNILSEEYIEISGVGKVYFDIDINGHYYPTLANADITTTVTKTGHLIISDFTWSI